MVKKSNVVNLLIRKHLTVILRTRVVYELIADEVRSTEWVFAHVQQK